MKKIFVLISIFISALIYVNAQVCDVTISTTFAGGSGEDGNMFNITAVNTITINQFEGNINGDGGIQIYYKSGTYQGSEGNPGAWTYIGEVNVTSAGIGVPTSIPVTIDITIPAGQTYAFYITGVGTGATLVYTDGTQEDTVYVYDANMEIKEGIGIKYPYFTTFTPKVWNGIVHYTPYLTTTITKTDVTCNGGSDGSAFFTVVSGGTTPYDFIWSSGDTTLGTSSPTDSVTGLLAGTYSVTVTDVNGCSATDNISVSEPFISLSFDTTQSLCNEICDGMATVTPSGGTEPYTYLWDDGQTDSTATGLCMGTNAVTVTDANGCPKTDSVNISAGTPILLSFTTYGTSCSVCDGIAIVTPSSGIAPYTYLWSSGQTDSTVTGLCAGTYIVTVTDSIGCIEQDSLTISTAYQITFYTTITDEVCSGTCDGWAWAFSFDGGVPPYTCLWSNGQTDQNIVDLCAGNYSVTVTDANGCSASKNITINSLELSLSTNTSQSQCSICDGWAVVSTSGGSAPYSYLWSDGQTNSVATGLCAGIYTVTVTEGSIGCTATDTVTITSPYEISLSFSSSDDSCGVCDGTGTVTPSGGSAPYTYLWSDGQTDSTATGLCVGIYPVTVTNAESCSATGTVSITSLSGMSLSFSTTNASCCGVCDGISIVTPSGGSPPYAYLWNDGQTDSTATGLCAGTYQVTVTDALGCPIIDNITISEPFPVSLSVSSVDASACGACNGSATATASGGTAPYIYLWSNGQTDNTATDLCSGFYPVTVTDTEGCSATGTVIITGSFDPVIIKSLTVLNNITCFGDTNGTAKLSIWEFVTFPVDIIWSNGDSILGWNDTVYFATGLAAGLHFVLVTDTSVWCTDVDSVVITQPSALNLTINKADANCGINDGMAWIIANGATPPYTYLWSNGATQDTISGIFSGVYTVTVTDANGCEESGTANVNELDAPTITVDSVENVSCNGGNNGAIYLTATGGVLPYNFLWSNSDTTEDVSNLTEGEYIVSVTGANNCQSFEHIIINEPPAMNLAAFQVISQGAAYVIVTGGTPPYSYLWSSGGTEFTETGLADGVYTVTVTDNNWCTDSDSITITGSPVGILENTLSHNNIQIYPNPNTGRFTLEINISESTDLFIKIYMIEGKLIYSKKLRNTGKYNQQIDLSKYSKGLYYVQVISDRSVITKKVIYQ